MHELLARQFFEETYGTTLGPVLADLYWTEDSRTSEASRELRKLILFAEKTDLADWRSAIQEALLGMRAALRAARTPCIDTIRTEHRQLADDITSFIHQRQRLIANLDTLLSKLKSDSLVVEALLGALRELVQDHEQLICRSLNIILQIIHTSAIDVSQSR